MMKKLLLLLLLFTFFKVEAQSAFPFNKVTYYKIGNKKTSQEFYRENKVKQETETTFDGSGKKVKASRILTFNLMGCNTGTKDSRRKTETFYSWHNDSQLSSSVTLKKGDTAWFNINSYDANGRLTEIKYFNKNSQNCGQTLKYEYNTAGKTISRTTYDKKNKIKNRFQYEYYEDGQIKESRYYKGENKLKYKYTYECGPKGEVTKTAEKNFCLTKTQNNDGSFYEVMEVTEKGKESRQIYTYNADSQLVKFESFKLNGKLYYGVNYQYNENRKLSKYEWFDKNRKMVYFLAYSFNNKGLEEKNEYHNSKGKLVSIEKHNYEYYP